VSEVICGDTDYWVIEGRDNAVFIKPAKEGARTNVNVIAKSKTIYSFMVQEITKPGSKEQPDVKILLAGGCLFGRANHPPR
jgi:type IV secretory pathway VirB9-like protein